MATSAFESTSKRSYSFVGAAADAGSSNRAGVQRRSRSLCRFSGRFSPAATAEAEELPGAGARGRFGNAARGSGFPEISLDDLADEFFGVSKDVEEAERGRSGGRSGRRLSHAGFQMDTESSRRRGRSASRKGGFESNAGVKGVSDASARRRRSVSVVRQRCSDSESYSSTLTDDETWDVRGKKGGVEKTLRTVYSQKKTNCSGGDGEGNGLYQAMRKEVRHAVEEIRTELEKVVVKAKPAARSDDDDIQSKGSEAFEAISEIRRNYTTKLEESEKRKQELLAKLAAEEQRGQELTKIVRELLPDTKHSSPPEWPSRLTKRSNDRTRMSKRLTEEADKYFVDFISNVEETDISSFDGDKSDGSSSMGYMKSPARAGRPACLENVSSLPAEGDGLILPWLDWETCSDGTPVSCHSMSKVEFSVVSGTKLFDPKQQTCVTHDDSMFLTSSHGSWSPDDNDSCSIISKKKLTGIVSDAGSHLKIGAYVCHKVPSFEMEDYMNLDDSEDFLFEGMQQRQRIESGGLILCRRSFLS